MRVMVLPILFAVILWGLYMLAKPPRDL